MFESSPPGSFPLCANPSFEPYAARQLRALVEEISHGVRDFRPLGVVLTGSLARGEAALAAGEDRRTRWLSDIECMVVSRTPRENRGRRSTSHWAEPRRP
jgi:hypothetical protein